jgi:hypothetical protein
MANSKKKGNKSERELCKWFERWTGFEFARIPASGGLRWKGLANATTGDIICTDDIHGRRFLLSVESKSYKDINFEHLILGNKKAKIREFWEQAIEDGKRGNKVPILFMRYNGMKKDVYFVAIGHDIFKLLFPTFVKFEYNYFKVNGPNPMVILNSEDLKKFKYIDLHKKIKKSGRYGKKAN